MTSIDPIYQFSAWKDIQLRIRETYAEIIDQTRKNLNEFKWDKVQTLEELGRIRMEAMSKFLVDYQDDRSRYLPIELPNLPFGNEEFQLALCSHFLFLYSKQNSLYFHIQSLVELCRVATEVRVFPLLELGAIKSRHLDQTIRKLEQSGFKIEITRWIMSFRKAEMRCFASCAYDLNLRCCSIFE